MLEMKCPYCGEVVSTEGIYNAPTATVHRGKRRCPTCGLSFAFTAVQTWVYATHTADCLNGAPHDMEHLKSYNRTFGRRSRCRDCGEIEVEMAL